MPLGKFPWVFYKQERKWANIPFIFCKYGHVTAKHVLTECEHHMFGHQALKFKKKLSHQKFKGS